MNHSNIGSFTPTQLINDDLDTSDWDATANIWDFFTEDDQGNVDFYLEDGQVLTQCPGLDQTCEPHNIAGQAEQNRSLSEWDIQGFENFDIAEILSQDPDLGPSSTTHDLPLELPAIAPPFEPLTPEALEMILQQAPHAPRNDPSPDGVPLVIPDWLDRQVTMNDWEPSHQAGPKPANSSNMSEKDISFEVGHLLMGDTAATVQGPLGSELHRQEPPRTSRNAEPSRCAPCRFANIPKSKCNGSVGSICTRCERLKSKVDKKLVNAQSSFELFLSPNEPPTSLPKVIYFELMETQKLLAALRGEVDLISSFKPGDSLESLFDGNMLWHIDDQANVSQYSPSSSTIAVKRLATTTAETAAQPNGIVAPAMDAVQLDTFIDQRRPARETKGLADVDRETLTIAWRCAYWLTILLNWDANEIYLNRAGRDALSLTDAKNLVLELAYSVAHRIQVLIKKLCQRAIKSINHIDESLDPVTICCALWIVFSATHKFEKRNFQAKSLKNLRHFLGNLRDRSRAAFHSLDHYKRLMGASCCSRPRHNDGAFSKLIEDAKKPKAAVNFTAERYVSHPSFMSTRISVFDTGLRPQSYSEILESEVLFQEDVALFIGRAASRNLAAPRPSDRALQRTQEHASTSSSQASTFPSSSLSKSSSASSTDTLKADGFEARKRVLSDEDTSLSTWNTKRTRKSTPPGNV